MLAKHHAMRVNGKLRLGALLGRGSSKSVHLFLDKEVAVAVCTPRNGACFQHEVSILELVQGRPHLLQMIRGDPPSCARAGSFGSMVDLADTSSLLRNADAGARRVRCGPGGDGRPDAGGAGLGARRFARSNVLAFAFHLKVPVPHVKLGDLIQLQVYHGESLVALRYELHNLCPHNQVSPPP